MTAHSIHLEVVQITAPAPWRDCHRIPGQIQTEKFAAFRASSHYFHTSHLSTFARHAYNRESVDIHCCQAVAGQLKNMSFTLLD
ncbi:hypothetical protein NLK61_25645 [Pseudomonas fuscovaginae UPB0736]|uniref:hypothetical protein n=1 Tax=Pseudomonas asplenii TaxID=53407 RepID=UPI0011DC9B9B|nr:hypothetical protein [Pseudomonas fuscovaginae]UUQ64550.1 hypothetical protein NLK61_25645 [Pseudomonas fuscovaginae UPB0736]